ncbi:MAG: AAA family ATPase [Thermoproteota archaeon]
MSYYSIAKIVKEHWGSSVSFTGDQSFLDASNLVERAVKRSRLALVYGPPGTGKTTVYHHVMHKTLDNLGSDEILTYVCPTNALVADMLERIVATYSSQGKSKEDLIREVKVYGSKFNYEERFKTLRDCVTEDTRIILTTEFQKISLAPTFLKRASFHIMVDEASKSPTHTPFITFATQLLENPEDLSPLGSFSVIGDPNQAIAIGDEYAGRKDLLLLPRLTAGLLNKEASIPANYTDMSAMIDGAYRHLKGKYFSMLELSHRLPSPTEKPISEGFYNGHLRAADESKVRLQGLWDKNLAARVKQQDETFKKMVNILEEGITTGRAIIYIETTQKSYRGYRYLDFDENRAEIGLYAASALAYICKKPTTVLTTYTDQEQQMKMLFRRDLAAFMGKYANLVRFSTVPRMLGSQSDIVVAVLGKEYISHHSHERTIYFREPETLNVQLSRHYRALVIVGNLQRLIKTVNRVHSAEGTTYFSNLKTTATKIYELAGYEVTSSRISRVADGDAAVYRKWS